MEGECEHEWKPDVKRKKAKDGSRLTVVYCVKCPLHRAVAIKKGKSPQLYQWKSTDASRGLADSDAAEA
jgi:hypothetical protein